MSSFNNGLTTRGNINVKKSSCLGGRLVGKLLVVLGTLVMLMDCSNGPPLELLVPSLTPIPWRPAAAVKNSELIVAANAWTSAKYSGSGELRLQAVEGRELGTWDVEVVLTRAGGVRLKAMAHKRSFEMASNGDRWWVRDLETGILYEGAASREAAFDEGAVYLALQPLDLVEALLPQPLPHTVEGSRAVVVVGEDLGGHRLVWLQRDAMGDLRFRRELWLSPQTLRLVRLVDYASSLGLRQEMSYGDCPEGPETRPRRIELKVPRAGVLWQLALEQSAVEVTLEPGTFRLREGAGEVVRPLPAAR